MEARVIHPNDTIDVPFTFCPRQAIKYHETVTFEVNGLSKQKVEFFGTGSEMKVCLICIVFTFVLLRCVSVWKSNMRVS